MSIGFREKIRQGGNVTESDTSNILICKYMHLINVSPSETRLTSEGDRVYAANKDRTVCIRFFMPPAHGRLGSRGSALLVGCHAKKNDDEIVNGTGAEVYGRDHIENYQNDEHTLHSIIHNVPHFHCRCLSVSVCIYITIPKQKSHSKISANSKTQQPFYRLLRFFVSVPVRGVSCFLGFSQSAP